MRWGGGDLGHEANLHVRGYPFPPRYGKTGRRAAKQLAKSRGDAESVLASGTLNINRKGACQEKSPQ